MLILLLTLILTTHSELCQNNSDIKYELKYLSKLQNYPHQICEQYLSRTCCGSSNVDNIRQKVQKTLLPKSSLSYQCRQRLLKLFCSSCDGDIGIGIKQGICPQFSKQIYDTCSDDYFIFQIHGVLRSCDQDSIACSKLSTILETSNLKTSQLFGFRQIQNDEIFGKTQCFDGVSSSVQKGNGKHTSLYVSKNANSKTKGKKEETRSFYFNDIAQNLFISVGILMVATIFIMKCLKRNEDNDEEDD